MAFHRIIAALLLMAYAVTGTPLIPGTVAVLADLEGSHQGIVGLGHDGARITLHHSTGAYTPEVSDHRHCLARMIVRLCRPNSEGDHQMTASCITSILGEGRPAPSKVRSIDELPAAFILPSWKLVQTAPQAARLLLAGPRRQPPPSLALPSILTVRILV